MSTPMMKCGHAAMAQHTKEDKTTEPSCVICWPDPKSLQIDSEYKPPENRMARCSYYGRTPKGTNHSSETCKRGEICKCEKPSDVELAFFGQRVGEYDEYYCGCFGWE